MAQVLVCCEECRGAGKVDPCIIRYGIDQVDRPRATPDPCPVCGGTGEVWAEEPKWEPRILLDEVASEMWAEEDAP